MVASYVEVGSAGNFVCSYALTGFDIAKDSDFCHSSLRSVWVRKELKENPGIGLEQGCGRRAVATRRSPIPIFTPSVPTLVPFSPNNLHTRRSAVSSSANRSLRTLLEYLERPGHAISIPTSTKVTHPVPFYPVLCHKAPQTQAVLLFPITLVHLVTRTCVLLRVVCLSNRSTTSDASGTFLDFPDAQQMTVARLIHWSTPKRRKAVSYLFALTFFASVVTVSTSNGLPCPARHDRRAYLDSEDDGTGGKDATVHVVEKKQRRWIQETRPTPTGHWPT